MGRFNRKSRSERHADKFDKKIFSRAWEGKTWRIIVSVHAYKGGSPKLMLTRERTGRKFENAPFAKLGRISKEEMMGIYPLLQEALFHMGLRNLSAKETGASRPSPQQVTREIIPSKNDETNAGDEELESEPGPEEGEDPDEDVWEDEA